MAIKDGNHDVNEANAACLFINREARHQMPTGMAIMTFSTFADLDG